MNQILKSALLLSSVILFSYRTFENDLEKEAIAGIFSKNAPKERMAMNAPNLRAIVLSPSEKEAKKASKGARGIVADSRYALEGSDELAPLLEPFLNQPLTHDSVRAIKSTILKYYHGIGYPFVLAVVPQQDITNGVLQVVIIEGKIGTITVEGNKWFPSKLLAHYIRQESGKRIDTEALLEDAAWINRNPFRQVELLFAPGKEQGTTNLVLETQDRLPFRPYAGADNTGTQVTEEARIFGGFNWGNVLGLDHLATFQFTTAPSFNDFHAYTVQYQAPLPWRHLLWIYGGYAAVKGDIQGFDMNLHGSSTQGSLRYKIPIGSGYGKLLQEFDWGYDYKRTDNDLQFGEAVVSQTHADINQWDVEYSLDYTSRKAKVSLWLELFGSPFQMTPGQTNHAYQTLRPFAKALYAYGRARFSITRSIPHGFSLSAVLAGQGASANLLPSEQFGLGGYDTVRGYEEREVNVDNGVLLSGELHFPSFNVLGLKRKKWSDKMEVLVFIDYGAGRNHKLYPGEKTQQLLGIGPGLRYTIGPYLFFRSDWGFQMRHTGLSHKRSMKWHVGGTVSY